MKYLLWKDFYLSRSVMAAGVVLTMAPYLLVFMYTSIQAAWELSTYCSQFTMALLAGNIIACERADRSAEFLAFQGVSRFRILASKTIVCLVGYLAVCAVMIVTRLLLPPEVTVLAKPTWLVCYLLLTGAATGLAFWGCCWGLSTFQNNPAVAVTVGALAPGIVIFAIAQYQLTTQTKLGVHWWPCYIILCMVIGLGAYAAGVWYYLRRSEP